MVLIPNLFLVPEPVDFSFNIFFYKKLNKLKDSMGIVAPRIVPF